MITMGHACGAERGPNRQQPPPVFPNPSQSHQLQTLILIQTDNKEYNMYIFTQILSKKVCFVSFIIEAFFFIYENDSPG